MYDEDYQHEYHQNIIKETDTLLLSDVIVLKEEAFQITYISEHDITLKDKKGKFTEKKIKDLSSPITLVYRSNLLGYAKQNLLNIGTDIILTFQDNVIIKGKIIEQQNDSILIETFTEGNIFIDFEYKGFKPPLNGLLSIDIDTGEDEDEDEDVEQQESNNFQAIITKLKHDKTLFNKADKPQSFYKSLFESCAEIDLLHNSFTRFKIIKHRPPPDYRRKIARILHNFGSVPKKYKRFLKSSIGKPVRSTYEAWKTKLSTMPPFKGVTFEINEYQHSFKIFDFTEILAYCQRIDFAETYIALLKSQTSLRPSINDYIKFVILELKKEQKEKRKKRTPKTCIIAKEYYNLEDIYADNDKIVYFDEKYNNDDVGEKFLLRTSNIPESNEESLETTHREVIDGEFAILVNTDGTIKYFQRNNNRWELFSTPIDIKDVIVSNTNTDSMLCHLQAELHTNYLNIETLSQKEYEYCLKRLEWKHQQTFSWRQFGVSDGGVVGAESSHDDTNDQLYINDNNNKDIFRPTYQIPTLTFFSTLTAKKHFEIIDWALLIYSVFEFERDTEIDFDFVKATSVHNDVISILSSFFVVIQLTKSDNFTGFPIFTSNTNSVSGLNRYLNIFIEYYVNHRDLFPWSTLHTKLHVSSNKMVMLQKISDRVIEYLQDKMLNNSTFLIKRLLFRRKKRIIETISPHLIKKSLLTNTTVDHANIDIVKAKYIFDPSSSVLLNNILKPLESVLFWTSKTTERLPVTVLPFDEQIIYKCFIKYCKFTDICPLFQQLASICDGQIKTQPQQSNNGGEDFLEDIDSYEKRIQIKFHPDSTIEDKIITMKDNGRQYNINNLLALLKFLHSKTLVFNAQTKQLLPINIFTDIISKTLESHPGHEILLKLYSFLKQECKQDDLLNMLIKSNEHLQQKQPALYEYFTSKQKQHIIRQIRFWKDIIRNMVKVFGSMIKNKINERFSMLFDNKELLKQLDKIDEQGNIYLTIADNTPFDDNIFTIKLVEQLYLFYYINVIEIVEKIASADLLKHYIVVDIDMNDKSVKSLKKDTCRDIKEISLERKELLDAQSNFINMNIIFDDKRLVFN